jgi:hypothetical protein
VKTRTMTEFPGTVLILAVVLGLASLPAQGAILTPPSGSGGSGGGWSEPWSGLGSLWDGMLSLLGFQGRPGPGAATRGASFRSVKTSGATPGAPIPPISPTTASGVSNSTINPDGIVSLTP